MKKETKFIHFLGTDWGMDATFAPGKDGKIVPHIWAYPVGSFRKDIELQGPVSDNKFQVFLPNDWGWFIPEIKYKSEISLNPLSSGNTARPVGRIGKKLWANYQPKISTRTQYCWCGCGNEEYDYLVWASFPLGVVGMPLSAQGARFVLAPRGCGICDEIILVPL